MDKQSDQYQSETNPPLDFLAGLLLGSLVGAAATLLLAPQSGEKTRAQIQLKSVELRDQTAVAVEDAVAQSRVKVRQITADVRAKAEELQHQGQNLLDEQKARVSAVVEAAGNGKPAPHSS